MKKNLSIITVNWLQSNFDLINYYISRFIHAHSIFWLFIKKIGILLIIINVRDTWKLHFKKYKNMSNTYPFSNNRITKLFEAGWKLTLLRGVHHIKTALKCKAYIELKWGYVCVPHVNKNSCVFLLKVMLSAKLTFSLLSLLEDITSNSKKQLIFVKFSALRGE